MTKNAEIPARYPISGKNSGRKLGQRQGVKFFVWSFRDIIFGGVP